LDMNKALIEPSSGGGTEITRFNAMKHGILSRFTVLPWEDRKEYQALLTALLAEHMPVGPTEEHLVEELAGILWRKRRLRLAEAAAYNHGLNNAIKPFRDTAEAALAHVQGGKGNASTVQAVQSTADKTNADVRDMQEDEAMTLRALEILNSGGNDTYEAALAALREDTQRWWSELLDGETDDEDLSDNPITPDAESLRRFIEKDVLPWFENRKRELSNRPLIRDQAFGEALDPDKLERLGRYEVHLDRKLERMLTMLLKLKEMRSVQPDA
jgi:hypothetical protein